MPRCFAVLAAIAACCAAVHAHSCGTGASSALHPTDMATPAAQTYHTTHAVGSRDARAPARRRLAQTQANEPYPGGAGFLPVADAKEAGLTRPLRLQVVWDLVEGLDNARQCTSVGESVPDGQDPQTNLVCTEDQVVTAEKLAIVKQRFSFAASLLGQAIELKPVQDAVTIQASVINSFNLQALPANRRSFADADLVVIMTMHPESSGSISGYAYCVQTDQYGRCTVGFFNWCPNVLDVEASEAGDVVEKERRTAVHEVIHLLGGILPGPHFINPRTGTPRPSSEVYVIEADGPRYSKQVMKIRTQRVLAMVREHYACPDITGMPVEDQPTGAGAHWEARLMGPELMSYGAGSGEGYLSALTLAFLEDTGQYIANYSVGGRLVTPSAVEDSTQARALTAAGGSTTATVVLSDPPAARLPSAMRWGRDGGCPFFYGGPAQWTDVAFPSTNGKRYTCDDASSFSCTYDNRMAAGCSFRETLTGRNPYSCVDSDTGRRCAENADSPSLPAEYRYFQSATAGGYNDAMDHVPTHIGYWNCADQQPSQSTKAAEGGISLRFGNTFKNAGQDSKLFGGQTYCPDCRCFQSSLIDASSFINPTFPRYGLCYRANCVTANRLQFGVRGNLGGTFWYACPPEGGKLFVPGFTGAFHCPNATSFCKWETVSGILFPETDRTKEYIILAVGVGLPLIIVCSILCIPSLRRRVKAALCRLCGRQQPERKPTRRRASQPRKPAKRSSVPPPGTAPREVAMVERRGKSDGKRRHAAPPGPPPPAASGHKKDKRRQKKRHAPPPGPPPPGAVKAKRKAAAVVGPPPGPPPKGTLMAKRKSKLIGPPSTPPPKGTLMAKKKKTKEQRRRERKERAAALPAPPTTFTGPAAAGRAKRSSDEAVVDVEDVAAVVVVSDVSVSTSCRGERKSAGAGDDAGKAGSAGALLPAGWEAHETEEGKPYFHNSETGETTWERPVWKPASSAAVVAVPGVSAVVVDVEEE